MFFGTMAAMSIAASACDHARREAEAQGKKVAPEDHRRLMAMLDAVKRIREDERTAYEDAGLLPVYPRP